MKLTSKFLAIFLVLFLNSADLLNLVYIKFAFELKQLFFFINLFLGFLLLILAYILGFIRRSLSISALTAILITCITLQLANGLINGYGFDALSVYFSILFCFFALWFFNNLSDIDALLFIRIVYFSTIILYVLFDIASIAIFGSSQHHIVSNIIPILILVFFTLASNDRRDKQYRKILLFLFLFIGWCYTSAYIFTEDQRHQLKPYLYGFFLLTVFPLLMMSLRFSVFSRVLRSRSIMALGTIIVSGVLVLSSIAIYQIMKGMELLGRENSFYLRDEVNLQMIDKWLATPFTTLYGTGLGSSSYDYEIELDGALLILRSHSGLLSLLVEHGLTLIPIFIILIFKIFDASNVRLKLIKFDSYSIINISLIVLFWLSYNFTYIFALPLPNYPDQGQLLMTLFLIAYNFRKLRANQ